MRAYQLTVERDDNDTWLVTCPDLPEVVTFVERLDDLHRIAGDAVAVAIASRMSDREDIPMPRGTNEVGQYFMPIRMQTVLKIGLHNASLERGATRADLKRKLGWNRESVDRLFRLHHNSRLDQIEDAYAALGVDLSAGLHLPTSLAGGDGTALTFDKG